MRILVIGKSGQVGRELARAVWAADSEVVVLGRSECDLADLSAVRQAIRSARPQFVINAAAYTAVDRAEAEPGLAEMVNGKAPAIMAEACAALRACLVHLSTDYVFDGRKAGPYIEDDVAAPLSVYGRTKAQGETAVRERLDRHVILRTSWVFAAHGANFVRTMLRLSAERAELRIVCDQHGAPTCARDIAGAIVAIVEAVSRAEGGFGTFHFSSAESTTWHGFARAILDMAGRDTNLVPIATADYKTAARRPSNSVLDCGRIARTYGIAQPSWRVALAEVLEEIRQSERTAGG